MLFINTCVEKSFVEFWNALIKFFSKKAVICIDIPLQSSFYYYIEHLPVVFASLTSPFPSHCSKLSSSFGASATLFGRSSAVDDLKTFKIPSRLMVHVCTTGKPFLSEKPLLYHNCAYFDLSRLLKPHVLSPFCFINFCYGVIMFRAVSFNFHAVQQKCRDASKTCKCFGRLD